MANLAQTRISNQPSRSQISAAGLVRAFFFIATNAAAVSTVTGFLGIYWWVFDLTSHFRLQYAATLLLAGIVFGWLRQWKRSMASLGFFTINFYLIYPYLLTQPMTRSNATSTRAMLMNVQTENRRYQEVQNLIQANQPDIIVLEEVDSEWLEALKPLRERFPHSVVCPRNDNFGVALFSRFPISRSETLYLCAAEVPTLLAEITVDGRPITVIGTHPLPPGSREYSANRNEQLKNLSGIVARQGNAILVLGDLNATPWCPFFQKFLTESHLVDSVKGFGLQPSWPTTFFLARIPLDHCLVSSELKIINRRIGPKFGSDHFPLIVDFTVSQH